VDEHPEPPLAPPFHPRLALGGGFGRGCQSLEANQGQQAAKDFFHEVISCIAGGLVSLFSHAFICPFSWEKAILKFSFNFRGIFMARGAGGATDEKRRLLCRFKEQMVTMQI
jgi:hypothetical protein